MPDAYIWTLTAVIALVTAAIRFLPFVIFRGTKKTPPLIEKLGKMLPHAIMGMLVVYCLKDVRFTSASEYLPALIACVIVGVLYIWKRNTLISILVGTLSYMVLIQMVF